jgi:hypothetical protein
MKRRTVLRTGVAAGAAGVAALAGCLGSGGSSPPPRRARVFRGVSLADRTMQIRFHADPRVESRAETVEESLRLGDLSPVGVASAQKGARGATRGSGSYANAPKGRHGWAVWHGGDYDDWRENHDDELRMYPAAIATAGVAYIGSDQRYRDDPPDAGPLPWDRTLESPAAGEAYEVPLSEAAPSSRPREGWYRVGTRLVAEDGDAGFGWQGADFEVDQESGGWTLDKAWHVRPRV